MTIFKVTYILLIWIIPILGSLYSFRKLKEEKQIELIKELRHPLSYLGIIPIFIGLLVFLTGSTSASGIKALSHLGIGLMLFGWFVTWVIRLVKREESTFKSIAMTLIGVFVLIAYMYLY